eukprot:TRINITY_DN67646_c0_g1_i1.p1 TRINITY_DN67646_c0_g1~~TRINITY_DN67646_c0_g1_i1.p1  ORF type:complete len:437 (+),score=114.92 TRINITY_DN67646_c0_g1_i1:84-1313(+)
MAAFTCFFSIHAFAVAVAASGQGLILLQQHAEVVTPVSRPTAPAPAAAEAAATDNMSTKLEDFDARLQLQARREATHLQSTVSNFSETLKQEQARIDAVEAANSKLQHDIEMQQTRNMALRQEINTTKLRIDSVANGLRTYASTLSRAAGGLDSILSEDSEDVQLHASEHTSILQVEDVPDESMESIRASLEDIHAKIESEVSDTFNKSYRSLLAREKQALEKQAALKRTLAVERQHGVALTADLKRLQKLLAEISDVGSVEQKVHGLGEAVSRNKALAEKLNVSATEEKRKVSPKMNATSSKDKSSDEDSKDGFFSRVFKAYKAAVSMSGATIPSVFGGTNLQAGLNEVNLTKEVAEKEKAAEGAKAKGSAGGAEAKKSAKEKSTQQLRATARKVARRAKKHRAKIAH